MMMETATWALPAATVVFALGVASRARLLLVKKPQGKMPERELEIPGRAWGGALADTVFSPFLRFGLRANPARTGTWAAFHLGMLLVMIHGLGALITFLGATGEGPGMALVRVMMQEHDKPPLQNLMESAGALLALGGGLGLLWFRLRGTTGAMRHPVDGPTRAAGTRTRGYPSRGETALILLVLALLSSGMMVRYYGASFLGLHGVVAAVFLAVLPFTRLFHFIFSYWVGVVYAVERRVRRTIA
jgi:hypothetical protein